MLKLLDNVKVLDMTRLLPGGFCTMLLSDLGAEVIKVEQPGRGDYMRDAPPFFRGTSLIFNTVNRNKKSIAVDLKRAEGRSILESLIKECDVFIEGFRPGVIENLGFPYSRVSTLNKRIIYCSISSFGRKCELSKLPGHDLNFQGLVGLLKNKKVPEILLADLISGMYACIGILSALVSRIRPIYIDVPIVQSLLSLNLIQFALFFGEKERGTKNKNILDGSFCNYSLYKTKDGRYFALAAIEKEFMDNFIKASGLEKKSKKEIRRYFLKNNFNEILDICLKETCLTPVLTFEESINSRWSYEYQMIKYLANLPFLGNPLAPELKPKRAPRIGENTDEIILSLGYSESELKRLKKDKIIC